MSKQTFFWRFNRAKYRLRAVPNETCVRSIHRLLESAWTYFYSCFSGNWQHIEFLWSGVENLWSITNKQPGSHSLPEHISYVSVHGLYWATYSGISGDIGRKSEKGNLVHPVIKYISESSSWNYASCLRALPTVDNSFCKLKGSDFFLLLLPVWRRHSAPIR